MMLILNENLTDHRSPQTWPSIASNCIQWCQCHLITPPAQSYNSLPGWLEKHDLHTITNLLHTDRFSFSHNCDLILNLINHRPVFGWDRVRVSGRGKRSPIAGARPPSTPIGPTSKLYLLEASPKPHPNCEQKCLHQNTHNWARQLRVNTRLSRKYAPPLVTMPPNSFDENYCAGIMVRISPPYTNTSSSGLIWLFYKYIRKTWHKMYQI